MRWLFGISLGALMSFLCSAPLLAHDGCHLSVELQALFNDEPVLAAPVSGMADDTATLSDGITFTAEEPEGDYQLTAIADSCTAEATLRWGGLPDTATEAPAAEEALPLGLAVAVGAGLVVFGYFFIRPSKISGRKD